MSKLTIVPIFTTSYSGATWISNLISAHRDAFNIGPAHLSVEQPRSELGKACLWHREECPFWPKFAEILDPAKNFFTQLAEFSGKSVLVVYNPRSQVLQSQFDARLFRIQPLKIVRDGRALVVSVLKHVGNKYNNFYDASLHHLLPGFRRIDEFKVKDADPELRVRYEDFVLDGRNTLRLVGQRLGLEYDENALRFWEFDRHPTGGNNASIRLMKALHDASGPQKYKSEYYQRAYEILSKNPDKPIMDDRWKTLINDQDRFLYDYFCGAYHEKFGYQRDVFSPDTRDRFMKEFGLPKNPAKAPRTLRPDLVQRIAWSEERRAAIRTAP